MLTGIDVREIPGGRLPAPALDSFVGRERELTELDGLLDRCRLVTVSGTAGVGKTRLVTELLAGRADPVPYWVELASTGAGDPLAHTVASAVGVRLPPGDDPLDALVEGLRDRRVLLALDNCEHVVDGCAALVAALLRGCPGLRVLTTSREALRVPGEVTYRLAALPDPAAVQLFVTRAGECVPDFTLTDALAPAVAQICTRLDGLPLAIELAARRVRMWPIPELLDRLADRFDLLTVAPRHADRRHRSLSAVVDWSYRLLPPAEQLLLQRMSVLAGGFDITGLVAVCADERLPEAAVLPALTGLEEKSLVVPVPREATRARFRQLETIRLYAWRRLVESGEAEHWQGRLAGWLAGVAELMLAAVVPGPDVVRRLDDEHDNLVQAVEWAAARDNAGHVLLAAALARSWRQRAQLAAARRVLRRALPPDGAPDGTPPECGAPDRHLAEALGQEAVLAFMQGDMARGVALGERVLGIGRRLGDPILLIRALYASAVGQLARDDPAAARRHLQECAELVYALAEPLSRAVFLQNLAWSRLQLGDVDEAAALLGVALPLYLDHVDGYRRGDALHTLGALALVRGDLGRAEVHFARALDLAAPTTAPACLEGQAVVAARKGQHDRALRLYATASQLRETNQVEPEPWWRRQLDEALGPSRRALGSGRLPVEQAAPVVAGTDPGLTVRERAVAELVAGGLTNRQIAARLGLSTRTVDAHLAHIRRKLAVTSRAQIAVWAAEHP